MSCKYYSWYLRFYSCKELKNLQNRKYLMLAKYFTVDIAVACTHAMIGSCSHCLVCLDHTGQLLSAARLLCSWPGPPDRGYQARLHVCGWGGVCVCV